MNNKPNRGTGRPRKNMNNVEVKAISSWSGQTSSIQVNLPSTVSLPSTSIDLMSYNRGYVSACVSKISNVIGSLPFKLYSYQDSKDIKPFTKSLNNLIQKRIKSESKAYNTEKKQLVEIYNHPFIDLINIPYQDWTISSFFAVISSYLNIIGNAYIFKHLDSDNQLTGLQVLEGEYISIKYNTNGEITSYIYQPNGCRSSITFNPEQLVHIKNRTAGSIIVGRGELENCLESFTMMQESLKYTKTLLVNGCVPGYIVNVKNKIGTSEAATKMAKSFVEQFSSDNRGKNLVAFGDIAIDKVASNLSDNLTDKFWEIGKKEIAAVMGVPLDLIDTSNSNRATAQVAQETLLKFTIYPKIFNILDQLNSQIVKPYYTDDLLFWVDTSEALEDAPQDQANLYKSYLDMGILTKEEVRTKLGFGQMTITELN